MEIEIVTMNASQVDSVWEIEKALIASPWSKESIQKLTTTDNAVAKVATIDGKVVGYYSFYQILDEADVNNIAVDSAWQNKGIGSALMLDMIDECKQRDISAITLEVGANNVVAQRLYDKWGFRQEGLRKKYYNNTEDAIIMWRR
ncbi:MAG: ribosomal protein S18-alanine N-acetyltransferase [Christensenellales bacterium]